jgi:ribosomal protein L32
MKKNASLYGNCATCLQYARLDERKRCPTCASQEEVEIEAARNYLANHPDATREQVASALDVEQNQVDEWIQMKKIHCISIQETCPECGHRIINKLSCGYCGFNSKLSHYKNEKITSSRMVYPEKVRENPAGNKSVPMRQRVSNS